MAGQTYGYDVVLVAFGAGCDNQAGSAHFVSGMTPVEVAQTDAMYCVEALFAGDKLYASAGLNSLSLDKEGKPAKVYEKTAQTLRGDRCRDRLRPRHDQL
jgi:hypothetical protein